ncbi:SDR family oxidoreductase [Rhabdothermincola salaria]|uniref:SDR family oxidoreductase n=1 Tax=Rhabdothermincola salaria TaxID=2903142 RepID=UPI001E413F2F|nr:SDR family oxidoreductase [Rhabdothermincola salaria]
MILDLFRLDGKVAIVTAAGRGIGARIATAFAEVGADVVIGARTEEQLREVADQVEALGRRAVVVPGDLSTREAMGTLVDTAISELGRIDIVVNNAGGSMPQPFMDTTEKAFDHALRWNVTTAFNLSQLAVPHLLEQGGGSILNITSVAGSFADRGFTAYGTAKGALMKLTRHMAQDLAPKIRVNSVSPGSIATSALDMVLQMPELEQAMIDGTPLGRLGTVDDIAAAAVFLSSEAGSYVTGRDIRVDGGIEGSNLEMGIPDL